MFRLAVWFQSSAQSKVERVGALHGNYRAKKKKTCRRADYDSTLIANLSIMGIILPFPVTCATLEREGAP